MSEYLIAILLFAVCFALKGEYAICIALLIYDAIFTIALSFYSNE